MARYGRLILVLWMAMGWGPAFGDEPIDKLIRQLDQAIPQGRADAARQLALFGTDAARATDALIHSLKDTQSDTRLSAAYALGCVQVDSSRVLTALLPLLTDADEHVRYSAQWSIAKIARSLSSDQDVESVSQLVAALRQAIKEMRPREHQERHVITIELALSRLEQLQLPRVVTVPAPRSEQEAEEVARAKAMVESMYQATDAVGRYQFVRRLANMDLYPDSLRRLVLEKESRQADPSVLRYAVTRWGGRARSLLADILNQRLISQQLTDEDVTLLSEMTPNSAETRLQVMQIASDPTRSYDLRAAAFQALGRSPDVERELITGWCKLIADQQVDLALRSCALESMSELGSRAMDAQAQLLALLPQVQDPAMIGSLARTLVAIAPTSAPVSSVLLELLKQTSTDSPLYVDLVEACRGMGPAASAFQSEFVRGLTHADVYTRGKCVEALRQIGSSDPAVTHALIERIADNTEEIYIKNEAAETLASMGIPGQLAVAKWLSAAFRAGDYGRMTELLRTVAIVGGSAESVGEMCLAILADSHGELDTHVAAATALSAVRPAASAAVKKLDELCSADCPETLRSAALISLAQLNGQAAQRHLDAFAADPSILLRASAAYGRHLTGDSRAAFEALISLIDGSDTDQIISRCLVDMGSVIEPWLIDTAGDEQADSNAREICFSLACEASNPDWNRLLPMVDDGQVGSRFVVIAEAAVQSEEGIETILRLLESGRMKPSGQSRLIDMLFPDGLGAGDDQTDWNVLTLQQPGARAVLAARAAAEAAPAPQAIETPAAPAREREPVMPRIEVPIAQDVPRDKPEIVEVFYGTNRGRITSGKDKHDVAVAVLATTGGGMLAMLFCLVGFVRSGHRFYAVLALLAMGLAAPFGYQAALKYSGDALRPSINYDGTYQRDVELGICQVSIPPGHKPGELEAPQLLQLQFKQELDKHVVLTKVEPQSQEAFFTNVQRTMDTKGKNILVFIHGYNVSFEDAARRTAQMAFDLKFAGAPMFYSWPSQANWYGYPTDRENIELSVTQIKQFLLDLADKSGAETINLVAHSMGNVGLTQALKEIDRNSPDPMFNQVVLAAPDIDADIFKERIAPEIVGKAKHMTLYTSQTDLALIASRYFNHGKRVGDSTDGVPLFDRIETIDATSIDSSLIGHSYYGSNVSVLTDLGHVLMNRPASSREYLQTISSTPHPYWTFDVTRVSDKSTSGTTR